MSLPSSSVFIWTKLEMPEGRFLRRVLSDPADGLTRFFLSFFSDLNFVGHRFLSEIRILAEALQETLS